MMTKRKVQYDLKARNILISSLGVNDYHSVSRRKTTKDMWEASKTLHEGTDDVKQSKINTLVQQCEPFRMEDGETISSMQMRFTHIVNKLQNLGKTISNQDCTNKILRCRIKEWQPKVTGIKESQNLNALSMITLFGKLKEHEHEINRFKSSEDESKKKERKSISFNTTLSVSTSSV
jgi:antirestriction protein